MQTYHYSAVREVREEARRTTPDGDGSLLDHSILLYGSGMSNSNLHSHKDLPLVVVGGGAGQVRGNRHLAYPTLDADREPAAGLWSEDGLQMETFGDSNGVVDL